MVLAFIFIKRLHLNLLISLDLTFSLPFPPFFYFICGFPIRDALITLFLTDTDFQFSVDLLDLKTLTQ